MKKWLPEGMRTLVVTTTAAVLIVAACRTAGPPSTTWVDPAAHTEGFVSVPGARLHYLDWGGAGPPLILVHGLGDNPHAFDDLAPSLTGRFRVLAYARRGHGLSSKAGPFDNAALVGDLVALMDSLRIESADLAGWSMGGNEITAIAVSHPARVGKIVYLDAGFDWADSGFAVAVQHWPLTLAAPAETYASLEAFRQWEYATWFPGVADKTRVESYIRGLVEVAPDSSVRPLMSDSVTGLAYAALLANHRDYRRVKVPALAIYATSFVDTVRGDSARRVRTRAWEEEYMRPFRATSMARITAEIPTLKTLTVPGTHADFMFTSRELVASAIIAFLTGR